MHSNQVFCGQPTHTQWYRLRGHWHHVQRIQAAHNWSFAGIQQEPVHLVQGEKVRTDVCDLLQGHVYARVFQCARCGGVEGRLCTRRRMTMPAPMLIKLSPPVLYLCNCMLHSACTAAARNRRWGACAGTHISHTHRNIATYGSPRHRQVHARASTGPARPRRARAWVWVPCFARAHDVPGTIWAQCVWSPHPDIPPLFGRVAHDHAGSA